MESPKTSLRAGQVLSGPLFSESMRVETVQSNGPGRWVVVLVGVDSERFRRVALTEADVHAAMLLQAGGRTNALRALLNSEHDRGRDFVRLANALSPLYPKGSEEKRLLEAMLLAVPQ